ncbi:Peptidase family S41 [Phycisphaerae bacterium RAS1]|nr:Peptidase family S41 [Phycisphaerae bacterium RAS1]
MIFRRALVQLLAAAVLIPALSAQAAAEDVNWSDDLTALVEGLATKHLNPFFKIKREEFEAAAGKLRDRLPDLPAWQIPVEIQRLVAMIGDAHTGVGSPARPLTRQYPLVLAWLSDGVFVAATTEPHAGLLKARLLRVGDKSVDDAAKAVVPFAAVENRASFERVAARHLAVPEYLKAGGVIDDMDAAAFAFRTADGKELSITLTPSASVSAAEWKIAPADDVTKQSPSRRRQRDTYGFHLIPDSKAIYVWYDQCTSAAFKSIPDWSKETLTAIDENNVERVVFDLRRNGGGNSALLAPMLVGLQSRETIARPGGLVILIGRNTFSSAELNAEALRRIDGAILMGYPTGQKPNAYGEVKTFTLPSSKLVVQYSTKFFKRTDEDVESLMPDVRVEMASADFFAGGDVVLDAALSWRPPATQPDRE